MKNVASSSDPADASQCAAIGLSVHSSFVDGAACTHVEWLIRDPIRKLRTNCGFPVVSPEFDLDQGFSLRFAFVAGEMWAAKCNKANRRQKKKASTTEEPPSYGSLQLKVVSGFRLDACASRASVSVGGVRQGLVELAECAMQGIDLVADWQTQLEGDDGRDLRICIDLIRV